MKKKKEKGRKKERKGRRGTSVGELDDDGLDLLARIVLRVHKVGRTRENNEKENRKKKKKKKRKRKWRIETPRRTK